MISTQRATLKLLSRRAFPAIAAARPLSAGAHVVPAPKMVPPPPPTSAAITEDFVRMSINNMMSAKSAGAAPHISDEALKKIAQAFQNQLEDARMCVHDVQEAIDTAAWKEEYTNAENALDEAVMSFVDLIDALQRSTPEQRQPWNSLRERAFLLKELRQTLDELTPLPLPAAAN